MWSLSDPKRLSSRARAALARSEVIASVANLWELLLKTQKKGYSSRIHFVVGEISHRKRDPFDRILVAQALVEKVPLVSKDEGLARYGVTIW